jgi:hypothetical protein
MLDGFFVRQPPAERRARLLLGALERCLRNCCGWATAEAAIVTDIATAINKASASRFILITHLLPPIAINTA